MSILKRLFGSSSGDSGSSDVKGEGYEGFTIFVEPMRDGPKWRLAARIEKEIDGEVRVHQMIRADTFESADAAASAAIAKAKMLIDQQADSIFD